MKLLNNDLSLEQFLEIYDQFSLGRLTTEGFHPKTKNLSSIIKNDLNAGIKILNEVDKDALIKLKSYADEIFYLSQVIQLTIKEGGRVYLCGCGATGRLSLSLEKIFRHKFKNAPKSESVVSFMAGGDFAIIKSVESFEDNPEFGKLQLRELGFTKNDLFIGITEGGETSFVIGATWEALKISHRRPFFIYCNPDEDLMSIKRSKEIITNKKIEKINLSVAEMAISGSTRMQAATVQMLAVGMALFYEYKDKQKFLEIFYHFLDDLLELDISFLEKFIRAESHHYKNNGILSYVGDSDLGICILTDTTERSPTFSLRPFESSDRSDLSLSYLSLNDGHTSINAWCNLLGRLPRCLNWTEYSEEISFNKLLDFDISTNAISRRSALHDNHLCFEILSKNHDLFFSFNGHTQLLEKKWEDLFFNHMALKLILNTHSTLVMGLLGRYEGNMMTFVRASNMKLVDRAYRYINHFLTEKNIRISKKDILKAILSYNHMPDELHQHSGMVLKIAKELMVKN